MSIFQQHLKTLTITDTINPIRYHMVMVHVVRQKEKVRGRRRRQNTRGRTHAGMRFLNASVRRGRLLRIHHTILHEFDNRSVAKEDA